MSSVSRVRHLASQLFGGAAEPALSPEAAALEVEVVSSDTALAGLALEWDQLFERAGARLPFLTAAWLRTWWRVLGQQGRAVSHRLHVVAVRQAGRLVAVAPFSVVTLAPGLRLVRMLGADPNLTEVRAVLVEPALEEAVYARLRRYFDEDFTAWEVLHWVGVPARWPVMGPMLRWGKTRDALYTPMFTLPLAQDEQAFRGTLKRNVKESLRHCYNSLKRENIEFTFEMLEGADAVGGFLPTFCRLHGLRADTANSVSHPDYFAPPTHRAFLEAVVAAMGPAARCGVLRIGGEPVAARLGFRHEDHLYLYYSGYEPAWGKYSIMTTTLMECLKAAMGQGVRVANLSVGRDVSKTRWGAREQGTVELFCAAPGLANGLAYKAYQRLKKSGAGKETVGEGLASHEREKDEPPTDVSVVVLTFRRPAELAEALASLKAQEGVRFEVVVVDDSGDGSAKPVFDAAGLANARFVARAVPTKGRPAVARNEALLGLKGEFVYFLDDDDQLPPGALAAHVASLRAHPEAAVSVGDLECFGADEEMVRDEKAYFARARDYLSGTGARHDAVVSRLLFGDTVLVCSSAMVRRDLALALGGFDESIPLCEDVEFFQRCIRAGGLTVTPAVVLRRRVAASSLIRVDARGIRIEKSYRLAQARFRERFGLAELARLKALERALRVRWP